MQGIGFLYTIDTICKKKKVLTTRNKLDAICHPTTKDLSVACRWVEHGKSAHVKTDMPSHISEFSLEDLAVAHTMFFPFSKQPM